MNCWPAFKLLGETILSTENITLKAKQNKKECPHNETLPSQWNKRTFMLLITVVSKSLKNIWSFWLLLWPLAERQFIIFFMYSVEVRSLLATKIALWDINKDYQLTTGGMFFKKYFLFGITLFLQNIVPETQRVVHFLSIIWFGNFLQKGKASFISHGAKINTAVQKLTPCGHCLKFISGEKESFKTTWWLLRGLKRWKSQ